MYPLIQSLLVKNHQTFSQKHGTTTFHHGTNATKHSTRGKINSMLLDELKISVMSLVLYLTVLLFCFLSTDEFSILDTIPMAQTSHLIQVIFFVHVGSWGMQYTLIKNRNYPERIYTCSKIKFSLELQRDFLKTRFSRYMLYRHNAAIGTDLNLVYWDNSLYQKTA